MLAKILAKMVEDLASKVNASGTSRDEDPTEGLADMLTKLRGKMGEDLASKLNVPGATSPFSTGGFLEDMLAKIQAKLGEDVDPNPDDEGLGTKEYSKYVPLYRATLSGDWETTRQFIQRNKEAVTTAINHSSETALYIAVEAGNSHVHFMEKLVEVMSEKDLEVQNSVGCTALSVAAMVGNTAAAKILVRKNPRLLYICNKLKYQPVHDAALHARKRTLVYLRQVTNANTEPIPYAGDTGFMHLVDVMISEFYDVALDLIKEYPKLATMVVVLVILELQCLRG